MIAFGGWGCNFTSGHTRWYKLESTEESDRLPKVISFAQKIDTTRGRCQALGKSFLAGGWTNPSERYYSNWIISPSRDETKKLLKPPPSFLLLLTLIALWPRNISAKAFPALLLWLAAAQWRQLLPRPSREVKEQPDCTKHLSIGCGDVCWTYFTRDVIFKVGTTKHRTRLFFCWND